MPTTCRKPVGGWWYLLGCPPAQDASHYKDYYIFLVRDLYKPSFATGILGGGQPKVFAPREGGGNDNFLVLL